MLLFKKVFNSQILIILVISIFAFGLRVYKINTDLLYHRDQGLVAMDIYKIWHDKKISLLGAPTDVDGIFHSPVYYWILTPFYMLGKGDIVYPAVAQIIFEMLSLPFLYLAVKKLFNKNTAILTLFIYAISYGLISYSRWFITVPFILPLANIFIYTLVFNKGIFLNSFLVGMMTQTNAAVGIFYLPFLIFHYRKNINIKNILLLIIGFLLPAIPLIIFQFRHDFVTVRAILTMSGSESVGLGFSLRIFINNFVLYLKEINKIILFPYLFLSTILFIYGVYKNRKNLILSYLFIPFIFLSLYQRGAITFFFIASLPMILITLSNAIFNLPKYLKYIILLIIILTNLYQLKNIYFPNNALIPIGDKNIITISDRKKVIDWMYEKAENKKFSIWIYTLPYFQDYPWEYLFLTYAKDKYGYLPEKTSSFSKDDLKESVYFFNIYEVDHDNLSRQKTWFEDINKNFGETKDYFSSNDIHIELRQKIK